MCSVPFSGCKSKESSTRFFIHVSGIMLSGMVEAFAAIIPLILQLHFFKSVAYFRIWGFVEQLGGRGYPWGIVGDLLDIHCDIQFSKHEIIKLIQGVQPISARPLGDQLEHKVKPYKALNKKLVSHYWKLAVVMYPEWMVEMTSSIDSSNIGKPIQAQILDHAPHLTILQWIDASIVACPDVCLAYDPKDNALLILVRGSTHLKDWIINLSCIKSQKGCSVVHGGIYESAEIILRMLKERLEEKLKGDKEMHIHCCGHSLGGGIASMMAIQLQTKYKNRIHGWSFGPPCVVDLQTACATKDYIYSFIYGRDVVARLSLQTVKNALYALYDLSLDTSYDEYLSALSDYFTQRYLDLKNLANLWTPIKVTTDEDTRDSEFRLNTPSGLQEAEELELRKSYAGCKTTSNDNASLAENNNRPKARNVKFASASCYQGHMKGINGSKSDCTPPWHMGSNRNGTLLCRNDGLKQEDGVSISEAATPVRIGGYVPLDHDFDCEGLSEFEASKDLWAMPAKLRLCIDDDINYADKRLLSPSSILSSVDADARVADNSDDRSYGILRNETAGLRASGSVYENSSCSSRCGLRISLDQIHAGDLPVMAGNELCDHIGNPYGQDCEVDSAFRGFDSNSCGASDASTPFHSAQDTPMRQDPIAQRYNNSGNNYSWIEACTWRVRQSLLGDDLNLEQKAPSICKRLLDGVSNAVLGLEAPAVRMRSVNRPQSRERRAGIETSRVSAAMVAPENSHTSNSGSVGKTRKNVETLPTQTPPTDASVGADRPQLRGLLYVLAENIYTKIYKNHISNLHTDLYPAGRVVHIIPSSDFRMMDSGFLGNRFRSDYSDEFVYSDVSDHREESRIPCYSAATVIDHLLHSYDRVFGTRHTRA